MLSEAQSSRLFTKKRTGIGVVCDVSIKGVRVFSEASIALGNQVTLHLSLPKPATPRQAATLFMLIAVMPDVRTSSMVKRAGLKGDGPVRSAAWALVKFGQLTKQKMGDNIPRLN